MPLSSPSSRKDKPPTTYKLDVRAGTAYYASDPNSDRGLIPIGSYSATSLSWTWREAAFPKGWPVDLFALKEATVSALLE